MNLYWSLINLIIRKINLLRRNMNLLCKIMNLSWTKDSFYPCLEWINTSLLCRNINLLWRNINLLWRNMNLLWRNNIDVLFRSVEDMGHADSWTIKFPGFQYLTGYSGSDSANWKCFFSSGSWLSQLKPPKHQK